MRKPIADILRVIALKLASPWYEPGIGVNPVMRADWLALRRVARRNWLKYAAITVFAYVLLPALGIWYYHSVETASPVTFKDTLGFFASHEGRRYLLIFDSWIFFLAYVAMSLMNVVNPLGHTGKHSIYDDPPVAPGFAAKFLYARLLPRLSILPLCAFITWLSTFGGGYWVVNYRVTSLPFVYLLLSLGTLLAFLHILGASLLIAVWINALFARAIVILTIVFAISLSPAVMYWFPAIDLEIFKWLWRPFGSVIAVDNQLLSFDEFGSNPRPPLLTVAATMLVQIAFVFAVWWFALSRYFRTFGCFSASGRKH